MTEGPDKIWHKVIQPDFDEHMQQWLIVSLDNNPTAMGEAPTYLLATPAREHAEEMQTYLHNAQLLLDRAVDEIQRSPIQWRLRQLRDEIELCLAKARGEDDG